MRLVEAAPPPQVMSAAPATPATVGAAILATTAPDGAFPQDLLLDVPLPVHVLLAQVTGLLGDLASLSVGKVIISNRGIGEPVDLYVNGVRIASGEIVNAEGSRGLRIRTVSVKA